MSWDQIWPLPHTSYSAEELATALDAVARSVDVAVERGDAGPVSKGHARFVFHVHLPPQLLQAAGDRPEHGPASDDGCYVGTMEVLFMPADDVVPQSWLLMVSSNTAQNADANLAISALAGRVSVLLGGRDQPL